MCGVHKGASVVAEVTRYLLSCDQSLRAGEELRLLRTSDAQGLTITVVSSRAFLLTDAIDGIYPRMQLAVVLLAHQTGSCFQSALSQLIEFNTTETAESLTLLWALLHRLIACGVFRTRTIQDAVDHAQIEVRRCLFLAQIQCAAAACVIAADASQAAHQAARADKESREAVLPAWCFEARIHDPRLFDSWKVLNQKSEAAAAQAIIPPAEALPRRGFALQRRTWNEPRLERSSQVPSLPSRPALTA